MMRKRPLLTIAVANFHTWLQSSRVLSMLGCMVFYCLLQVVVDHSNYALEGEKTLLFNVPELLFLKLYSSFFTMGSLLFLVMVSEIPLRYAFQNFMLVRTSRIKWTLAQVLHSAAAVCFAMGILCLCFSLFATFYASPTSGFSENALVELGIVTEDYTIIPLYIRRLGSPVLACLIALLPMFCFWFSMLLLILFLGLWNKPLLGPVLFGGLLLFSSTFMVEALPSWIPYPTDFSSLKAIVSDYEGHEWSRLAAVLVGYGIFDGIMILLMCIRSKCMDTSCFSIIS